MVCQFANVYLQSAINTLGTVSIAACAAASNIEGMIYHVLQGFGYACATFVGQNHGAGNDERCVKTVKKCFWLDYLFTVSICAVVLLLRYRIMGLFNSDPEVVDQACIRIILLFISYIFSISYEICSGYMRGYGKPLSPTIISLVCICGIRFLWIMLFFPYHHDFTSLMLVFPISIAVTAITISLRTLFFEIGRKKTLK